MPPDGYHWWYVDALSDDGETALTLIAFVGSVFSPWYFRARRRGPADPLEHCALNAVLYRPGGKRWAFTERGRGAVERETERFAVGPSEIAWRGDHLRVLLDEMSVPLPVRLRGEVRLFPETLNRQSWPLDANGLHHWQPVAPRARVEVDLDAPAERWKGSGYFDSNWGADSLERSFLGWDWSRAEIDGRGVVLYDVERTDGSHEALALGFDRDGSAAPFEPPPQTPLPKTAWRVRRGTRSERPAAAGVVRTLEDTPFYARSLVRSELLGRPCVAMHESLSLERFASPWVQCLLPFRAPRRSGRHRARRNRE